MENVNVLHPGDKQNDVNVLAPLHMSRFGDSLSAPFACAQPFGRLGLCFNFDALAKDEIYLKSAHKLTSYTLSDQLLSDVFLKKDFFQVTRRAILPNNWEKVFVNPPLGDDVPRDANSTVEDFDNKVATLVDMFHNNYINSNDPVDLFRLLVVLGYFYSSGSLLAASGFSMERQCAFLTNGGNTLVSIDDLLEEVYRSLNPVSIGLTSYTVTFNGQTYNVYSDVPQAFGSRSSYDISYRRFLELIQEDPAGLTSTSLTYYALDTYAQDLASAGSLVYITGQVGAPCDLAFLWAYQLCCAHFYSNDSVDFIYSADLFRQNVRAAVDQIIVSPLIGSTWDQQMTFTYNGVRTEYDSLCAHVWSIILSVGGAFSSLSGHVLAFLSLCFAWRNSLRFMDYFTGAKTRPLSIGNVSVDVNPGSPATVNVVDTIVQTQRARFFNAANRARRKIAGYLEDIFHSKPSHDWHDPLYLGHVEDMVYSVDTENTGSAQLSLDPSGNKTGMPSSVTSTFRTNGERFAFEVQIDEPSILIGICYFDIARIYTHATKRSFFHVDRFDMFNPFMQTIGDQELYQREISDIVQLGAAGDYDEPFGYKVRHSEYKEDFGRAVGPFVGSGVLRSWLVTDNAVARGDGAQMINPDYIRSSCVELDPYFLSLTHFGPRDYFHFIIKHYNTIGARRNMIAKPGLL